MYKNKKNLYIYFATFVGFIIIIFLLKLFFFSFRADVRSVSISNAEIAYYIKGEGYPLIMLPGFGMTMQHWDPLLLDKLSKKNKLIMFDYKGVGSSSGNAQNTSQQMTDDVIKLMDALEIKKANVLGWSIGSFVGQLLAEKYPERVNRLILISTAPGNKQIRENNENVGEDVQQKLNDKWEEAFVPQLFYSKTAKNMYLFRMRVAQVSGEISRGPQEDINAKIAHEQAFDNEKEENLRTSNLPMIQIPTLLISGENDKLILPDNAKYVASLIPKSELFLIPEAGHAVLFEKADNVTKLIDKFLQD
ncbi:MAG TPA: alpha/beta hydrolase [Candidatus Limnocylindrales bacterium]|nr:alpha/beta hydrolase [Candidatus Limnocylindrales bacterium]